MGGTVGGTGGRKMLKLCVESTGERHLGGLDEMYRLV